MWVWNSEESSVALSVLIKELLRHENFLGVNSSSIRNDINWRLRLLETKDPEERREGAARPR